jgi:TRAP-type C4-dicarboxylate transport system permease small subunit
VDKLRRFDDQVARVEGAVVTVVLLTMVLVASLQALFFNIAERGVAWAQSALEAMSFADTFLQKGTLWLAFVGASLATHADKHIGIDVLTKVTSPRTSAVMRALAALASGVIALVLARVFYDACLASDAAVPFDLELLTDAGPKHVCDVSSAALGDNTRPSVLCALRAGLRAVGVPVASGAGIAQLIVPVMFVFIGLRLLARGVALAAALARGETPPPPDEAPKKAEEKA